MSAASRSGIRGGVRAAAAAAAAGIALAVSAAAVPARPLADGKPAAGGARCDGLEKVKLSGGRLLNRNGRALGRGESGSIAVEMTNTGVRAVEYPSVRFAADQAGVAFGADNPKPSVYALAPGATARVSALAAIAASVRSGTAVRLTARLDVLHGGCANGGSLEWTAVVR